jgi:hypothetical protein
MHSPISNTQTVVLEKKFIQNQINIIVENKLKHVIVTKIKKYYMFWGKKWWVSISMCTNYDLHNKY